MRKRRWPEKKVSLSLTDELMEWWHSIPTQHRAETIRELIMKSAQYKEWRKSK